MTTSVLCTITYSYTVEVPDEISIDESLDNLIEYVDNNDPVYSELSKTLTKAHLVWDGEITSVTYAKTGEVLIEGC